MSWEAFKWARSVETGSASAKSILLALAHYADRKGHCFPSQERIADDTEMSVDTVQRRSRVLENKGIINRIKRKRSGGRWSYGYELNLGREFSKSDSRPASSGPQINDEAATSGPATPQPLPRADRKPRQDPLSESRKETDAASASASHIDLNSFRRRIIEWLGEDIYIGWFQCVRFGNATAEILTLIIDPTLCPGEPVLSPKGSKLIHDHILAQFEDQLLRCFRKEFPTIIRLRITF